MKKMLGIVGTCGFILACITSVPAWAYFSDKTGSEVSYEAIDSLDIELLETRWDATNTDDAGVPKQAASLVPSQVVEKNPQVKNLSTIPVWVSLTVSAPKAKITLVNPETQALECSEEAQSLFSYKLDPQNGWEEICDERVETSEDTELRTFIYCEPVEPLECTPELFSAVTVANLLEGSYVGTASIEVDARAVQAEGIETKEEAVEFFLEGDSAVVVKEVETW